MATLTASEPITVSDEVLAGISHITMVEMEEEDGYRSREVMPAGEVREYIERRESFGAGISDMECAMSCPCTQLRFPSWF